jgi:UDP-N-acetylmuramate--alanine ligase
MVLKDCRSVYFLGIGGIGMSALARYFHRLGIKVSGYDKTATVLTGELEAEGMSVHYEENPDLIPADVNLVVYTPAIPKDNKEFLQITRKKIIMKKRSEVLGMIAQEYCTFAVAGTHGKTTTSTLLAHILKTAGCGMVAFLGGISKNYSTNFLAPDTIPVQGQKPNGKKDFLVAEADEFDRSFLQIYPWAAIITSMDDDHLDIYKNTADLRKAFHEFASQVQPGGMLILKKGLPLKPVSDLDITTRTYSMKSGADYFPENIRKVNDHFEFDLVTPSKRYSEITLGLPGRFNLENAVAASALALETGIGEHAVREALSTFKGVRRRFDFRIRRDDFIYIDDYAHHPQELSACIRAVREIYPGRRITGVFQPHLFSRTKDFMDSFARSLELLDDLILLDIYPARENPIPGVTSQALLERVKMDHSMLCSPKNFLTELEKMHPEVLLTLGAGDIDQWTGKIVSMFSKQ